MSSAFQQLGITIAATAAISTAMTICQPLSAQAATIILDNGAVCEGNFKARTGNGICVFPDSSAENSLVVVGQTYNYYRGQIVNGVPNGSGTFVYKNDDRYEGQVRNGVPNGRGIYSFRNGTRYEGTFRDGSFHGTGTLAMWSNNVYAGTYTGNFREGSYSGKGKLVMSNGDRYEGTLIAGQPHGKGTIQYRGNTYKGDFYLGQVNGQGTLTTNEGVVCRGRFYSSQLSGKGTCTFPATSGIKSYTGELRDGKPDGRGTMVYTNGKRFVGKFRAGSALEGL